MLTTKKLLSQINEVIQIKLVTGAYQIIAKIVSSSIRELRDLIPRRINDLPTVHNTLALCVLQ
jgi:hypothetical protein